MSMSEKAEYLLMKRGLFWRPNYCGYTSKIEEAGLYEERDAKSRASSGHSTVHHKSEFIWPQFAYAPVSSEGKVNVDFLCSDVGNAECGLDYLTDHTIKRIRLTVEAS